MYEIAHARVVEQLRVPVGIEALERQVGNEGVERLVVEMLAVPRHDFRQRTRRVQHHVGLGFEERPVPVGVFVHGRERGHRRNVGVHEHAVAAVPEPVVSHAGGDASSYATRVIKTRTSTETPGGPWNTPFNGTTSA